MARKPKHEEHENHERWLVSYADFITLLFAFFVVMYSISSVNEGKFRVLSESLVAAFRASPKSFEPIQIGRKAKGREMQDLAAHKRPTVVSVPTVPIPAKRGKKEAQRPDPDAERGGERHEKRAPQTKDKGVGNAPEASAENRGGRELEVIRRISDAVEHAMEDLIQRDLIHVRRYERWVEIEINTNILFPSGSSDLSESARDILTRLGEILQKFPNPIQVEGHTDNVPIRTLAYPSNWELSAARAASVVHLFMRHGMDPIRMSAVGYGEYRPVAGNTTPAGRQKNRRVVLVVHAARDAQRIMSVAEVQEAGGAIRPAAPQIDSPEQDGDTAQAGAASATPQAHRGDLEDAAPFSPNPASGIVPIAPPMALPVPLPVRPFPIPERGGRSSRIGPGESG